MVYVPPGGTNGGVPVTVSNGGFAAQSLVMAGAGTGGTESTSSGPYLISSSSLYRYWPTTSGANSVLPRVANAGLKENWYSGPQSAAGLLFVSE